MSGEGRSSYYRHIFEAAKVSYTLQPQKVFLYSNGKKTWDDLFFNHY